MFLRTPRCPECESRFLVTKVRMAGGHVPPPSDLTVYRCWRCFAKFTDQEVTASGDGEVTASDDKGDGGGRGR